MSIMNSSNFVRGIGVGLMVGAAAGMAMSPKKKSKNVVSKALKAAGEMADNISDAMMR